MTKRLKKRPSNPPVIKKKNISHMERRFSILLDACLAQNKNMIVVRNRPADIKPVFESKSLLLIIKVIITVQKPAIALGIRDVTSITPLLSENGIIAQ